VLFGDLPVQPGPIYQLTVSLSDPDDDRTNDQIFLVFIRNANQ
jgi:hypothetical protein